MTTTKHIVNETEEMSEQELAAVAGGLTCEAGKAASAAYAAVSNVWFALGDSGAGDYFSGMAEGYRRGSCGK